MCVLLLFCVCKHVQTCFVGFGLFKQVSINTFHLVQIDSGCVKLCNSWLRIEIGILIWNVWMSELIRIFQVLEVAVLCLLSNGMCCYVCLVFLKLSHGHNITINHVYRTATKQDFTLIYCCPICLQYELWLSATRLLTVICLY